jgi:predicted ATPase
LDDLLTELAYHFSHSEDVDKAIEYLGRAGQQALQRSAHAEAVTSLTAAIDLLQRLPDGPDRIRLELPLRLALGAESSATKGWSAPEVEGAYMRARDLCERLGNPPETFWVVSGLHALYFVRGDIRPSYDLAEELLRRAESAGEAALLMFAHFHLGFATYQTGEFLRAREHLELAIALYDREHHRPLAFRSVGVDAEVMCVGCLAMTLWILGYPDRALKRGTEAIALATRMSHPFSLAFAENIVVVLHQFRREARAAQEHAKTVTKLSTEHGFALLLAWATANRGRAIAELGRHEEGIAHMRKGLAAAQERGSEMGRPRDLSLLAETCLAAGRLDDGLSAVR